MISRSLIVVALLAATLAAQTEMSLVATPGNAADTNGLGAVSDEFRIGTFEVTNTEYLAFLQAIAVSDPNGVFKSLMESSDRGGLEQSGSSGSFVYSIKPEFDQKPLVAMNWYDAARYCNWLHNGMPSGAQSASTTEDGAYDMSLAGDDIVRKPGALWFIPTHNEWYKAAYHDPLSAGADAGGTPNYWSYPTRSDSQPAKATANASGEVTNPGVNIANTDKGADWNGENGNVTTVGGCESFSHWGVFDLGGNANEITETLGTPISPSLPTRRLRGGDFASVEVLMISLEGVSGSLNMLAEGANIGFRVASLAEWEHLGSALAGSLGEPELHSLGSLEGQTLLRLELASAPAGGSAILVAGVNLLNLPFKGGTMVPTLDVLFPPRVVKPNGTLGLDLNWPTGLPSGVDIVTQYWINHPSGPLGWVASNATRSTTP